MKVDIKFDSLSEKEQIELAKEVMESTNPEIRRLIGRPEETIKEEQNEATINIASSLFEEIIDLVNNTKLAKFVRDNEIPIEILEIFSEHEADVVRIAVAANLNCPRALQEKIASDKSVKVREGMAKNDNTPIDLLEKLYQSDLVSVKVAVAQSKDVVMLEKLASSMDARIRKVVAMNQCTPIEILEKLSKDENMSVRVGVAINSNTTTELLEKLYTSSQRYTMSRRDAMYRALLKNPKCPARIIEELAEKVYYDDDLIKMVLNHNNVSEKVFEKLSQNIYLSVRIVVAKNPNTPIGILQKLANDPHEIVSKAAKSNPSYKKEN